MLERTPKERTFGPSLSTVFWSDSEISNSESRTICVGRGEGYLTKAINCFAGVVIDFS